MFFKQSKAQRITLACLMLMVNLSVMALETTNSHLSLTGQDSAETDAALSIFNGILAASSILVIINELRLMRNNRGRCKGLEAPETETLTNTTSPSALATSATLLRCSNMWRMYRKDSQMSISKVTHCAGRNEQASSVKIVSCQFCFIPGQTVTHPGCETPVVSNQEGACVTTG